MQDMGNVTLDADEIVRKSYGIVEKYVRGETLEEKVIQRCIIATGDPNVKDLIVFKGNAVEAGILAVLENTTVVCDVNMVSAGINRRRFRGDVFVAVKHGNDTRLTRAMCGMYALREKVDGGIAIVGNAPSAAIALYNLVQEGVRPKFIIATPVGFVNASESKEMIRELDIPSITTAGTRGGSTLAVAVFNALVNLAYERPS
ncbi:Cobalt-precorrin-8x methylmutase [Geoglobus acetivorans]|uniref:Cobalt-precorrin-8x methylmutase n=2 Tax=Geoglobus acetivorans TaxID=565033 RepID=A0A0A7GFM5_GEOAI|nr:Cobalt-precorrin-8x methylmutase [Geoglobus acetivorans]